MRTAATPRLRKSPVKEISLHMSVAAFLRHAWPQHLPVWHTPNGEVRDARTAGKLKGMGVLSGVPDFVLILPNAQAAFLELKTATSGLSDVQIEFRRKVVALGCAYAICRSLPEVEGTLKAWLDAYGLNLRGRLAA